MLAAIRCRYRGKPFRPLPHQRARIADGNFAQGRSPAGSFGNRGMLKAHPVVGPHQDDVLELVPTDGQRPMGRTEAGIDVPGMGQDQGPRFGTFIRLVGKERVLALMDSAIERR